MGSKRSLFKYSCRGFFVYTLSTISPSWNPNTASALRKPFEHLVTASPVSAITSTVTGDVEGTRIRQSGDGIVYVLEERMLSTPPATAGPVHHLERSAPHEVVPITAADWISLSSIMTLETVTKAAVNSPLPTV